MSASTRICLLWCQDSLATNTLHDIIFDFLEWTSGTDVKKFTYFVSQTYLTPPVQKPTIRRDSKITVLFVILHPVLWVILNFFTPGSLTWHVIPSHI
jgi:hypothetical protein